MQTIKANTRLLYSLYLKNNKKGVNYNIYKDIIHEFHKKISDEMLNGYQYQPYSRIGIFRIVLNFRPKRSEKYIDWGKSNKRKIEILARNGVLYEEWWEKDGVRIILNENKIIAHQLDRLEGAIKANNGGEKWIIHFNDTYYFTWAWHKNELTKHVRHITKYVFKATRFNKRSSSEIQKRTDSPELVYVIHNKKSKQSRDSSKGL